MRLGLLAVGAFALLTTGGPSRRAVWAAFTVLLAGRLVAEWPLPDNHLYLEAYWALAVALAVGGREPAAILRRSARLLIGTAFAFAVLWKAILSPDFRDERFFRVTLHQDPRMTHALRLAGLGETAIAANRGALRPWPAGVEPVDPPIVVEPQALRGLARALTRGGIALEGLIALAFLLPLPPAAAPLRALALLAFCLVVYWLAPVSGFAWLLLLMSLAALPPGASTLWRTAHVAVAGIVLLWGELPWRRLFETIGV